MNARAELLQELSQPGNKLTRTFQIIDSLEEMQPDGRRASIGISANVNVDLLSTFLRKQGLLTGTRLDVKIGAHNDPFTDASQFADAKLDAILLIHLFDNLIPGFESQLPNMTAEQVAEVLSDFRAKCRFVFERAKALPFVFVAEMHRFTPALSGQRDLIDQAVSQFNECLHQEAASFANVRIVETDAIVRALGAGQAFDARFYYQNTAPYTAAFHDELARALMLKSRGFNGYFYKALVLDCDNTLWGGIVGEVLAAGIKLDPHSYPGKVFWRAQQEFLALERQGILLCLCSKNNAQDVDDILANHANMVIRNGNIAIRKVNWNDKVSNLRAIAAELNIGLDSLVFVDDSSFECEAVRAALPMVRVFQVPSVLSGYANVVRDIKELFLSGGISAESASKTEQYRLISAANEARAAFSSHEDYLASLDLRVTLRQNDVSNEERISELTLKSNQFNLTTLRQTVSAIREKMQSADWSVYSLDVEDRFGAAGLTGVVLMHWEGDTAKIAGFLMSCRVIGRGVEFSIWPAILNDARARGCRYVEAQFIPTAKNELVVDFYDRLGLAVADENEGIKRYSMALDEFSPAGADWIKVIYG